MVAKVMLFYEKKAWRAKYFSVFAFFIVFSPSAVEFLYAEEDRVLECQRAVVHEKDGAVGRAFHFFYHAAVIRIEDVCQIGRASCRERVSEAV